MFGALVAGPVMFVMILVTMWLPGSVGMLISEAFAIRSWIFHALNGAISAWLGWQMFGRSTVGHVPMNETTFIFGAGLAGGFAYWAVAGRSAGFWKPVYPAGPRLRRRTSDPFNPPARTRSLTANAPISPANR